MTNLEMFFEALCNQELIYFDVLIKVKRGDVPEGMTFQTREDKWLYLLESGKGIYLVDEDEKIHITTDLINQRFEELKNNPSFLRVKADYLDGCDDSITADNLIQLVAYKDVIFG